MALEVRGRASAVKRLERKLPDRRPGLRDLEDTAEGRMNARRLIRPDVGAGLGTHQQRASAPTQA